MRLPSTSSQTCLHGPGGIERRDSCSRLSRSQPGLTRTSTAHTFTGRLFRPIRRLDDPLTNYDCGKTRLRAVRIQQAISSFSSTRFSNTSTRRMVPIDSPLPASQLYRHDVRGTSSDTAWKSNPDWVLGQSLRGTRRDQDGDSGVVAQALSRTVVNTTR
ncbi:hypothetical protein BJY59DRAFT_686690 [Rhodotorula toruloides]